VMMLMILALAADDIAPDVAPSTEHFAERVVAAHNAVRRDAGTPPLVWDRDLAADAQGWAHYLAKSNRFEHSPNNARKPEGENLWTGTSASYSFEEMVQSWSDEKQYFKPGRFPDITTTKSWADVGHYTQMIWYNTTAVGCAVTSNGTDDWLVCRYGPPGNWIGRNPLGEGHRR
jgi:uncharacterized protein YkwD